jgi:FAD dependent oxidoreductase TIGR03364
MQQKTEIAIIGAGIVGLAHALAYAKRGHQVTVFERNPQAVGASIRNFGMVWPIGQPAGKLLNRAIKSREIWLEIGQKADFKVDTCGSLMPFYENEEKAVVEEFFSANQKEGYQIELLSPMETLEKCQHINAHSLQGGLWSTTEAIVDPREAVRKIPAFLAKTYKVDFRFGETVTYIQSPHFEANTQKWQAEKILICSGADFETLYPQVYKANELTKCKLQMMRAKADIHLSTSLYGGLTLTHYNSFAQCPSLPYLKQKIASEMPEYPQWGIHVMICQNGNGELVIGDSHEYGLNPEPFDKSFINQLILSYLAKFTHLPEIKITETWHGVYPKMFNQNNLILQVEPNVFIINGLGGAGMTLSFGLAEENYQSWC